MRRRHWLWVIPTVLALVGAGVGAYLVLRPSGEARPRVETARVTRGDVVSRVTATGTVSPTVTVQVGSQVSGRVLEIAVDFNARVTRGQVVARIDPRVFEAEVERARANLQVARASVTRWEAELDNARRQHERAERLAASHLVSAADAELAQTTVKTSEAQLASARAAVAQAQAALGQAEANLAYTTIVSPTDGVVISRDVELGQTVAASLQAPTLFTIAQDLARMEVHTNVAEADIGSLTTGMPVEFTVDAYPEARFAGVVREVRYAPKTVQNVVTYDAVVAVDNGDLRLRPGMTAEVTFVLARRAGVLTVPNPALRFRPPEEGGRTAPPTGATQGGRSERGRERSVFVLGPGGALVRAPVELGITDGLVTEVLSGLDEGTAVATSMDGSGNGAGEKRARGPRFF